MSDLLIVSIGSTVMTDDAIGHHILQSLEEKGVEADFFDLGLDLFKLRIVFDKHKRIIILDAFSSSKHPPGKVLSYHYKDFQNKLEAKIRGIHQLGSIEALEIMRLADEDLARAEIYFVGIVIEKIDKGFELTSTIEKAISKAVKTVEELLSE
jgi:hydrogenase maturation protease